MSTYYEVLNITPNATNNDVNLAFKKIYNNFLNSQKTNKIIRDFELAKKGYQILSEYHSRRNYDNYLEKQNKKNLVGPNIDGMFRPFLRNSHLDNKVGNEFINAESQFNEMAKQMKDKGKSNLHSNYYLENQFSKT